ncbi:hypothetical protein [Actinocrispum wychmicini]|uniref:hypothetical protein n=1 Tax=Actinocrispum wychmicini TaxID=1213861 RepID=UPI001A9D85F2|nr:hypothetical protein [Actinocrispum wychmicini]
MPEAKMATAGSKPLTKTSKHSAAANPALTPGKNRTVHTTGDPHQARNFADITAQHPHP